MQNIPPITKPKTQSRASCVNAKSSPKDKVSKEAIPPLIEPLIFENCQKRLAENLHKKASFKTVEDKYLLTGKIFCGHCNATMSGESGTSNTGTTHRYYHCGAAKKACPCKCCLRLL